MALKRSPGRHSDRKFVDGSRRFRLAAFIVNANTPEEFKEKLQQYFSDAKDSKKITKAWLSIWQEYRILNLVMLIEEDLCMLLDKFRGTGHFKNGFTSFQELVVNRIMKHQKLRNKTKAKRWLYNTFYQSKKYSSGRIKQIDDIVCNSYVLLDIAGFSIGDFTGILCERIKFDFSSGKIIEDLKEFSSYRHHLFHNLVSSRRNYKKLISKGPKIGQRLLSNLKCLSDHLDQELKKQYSHTRDCSWCSNGL